LLLEKSKKSKQVGGGKKETSNAKGEDSDGGRSRQQGERGMTCRVKIPTVGYVIIGISLGGMFQKRN